jgi:hypothetical protein
MNVPEPQVQLRLLRPASNINITFPALTMVSTAPIFYKITVTTTLSEAVENGTYPNIENPPA